LELSTVDERLFSVVEGRALPKTGSLLQKVVWGAEDIRPHSVPRVALLEEVRAVAREIERDAELLSYAYAHSARMTYGNGTVFLTSGSGSTHGHRLAGDPDHAYGIDTGIGVCDLKKWGLDDRGRGVLLETVDCRQLKEIETAKEGTVVIKKRKIKANLGKSFAELQAFLERQTAEAIDIFRIDEEETARSLR